MKNYFKKMLVMITAIAILFASVPVMTARAAGETWISTGDGWHYLQGTDIKVQIANDMIHISGTGVLPDFDYWKLNERPWHTSTCHYLTIDSTITSIGSYAFYKMENIKHVFISTKTFITNRNAFEGIAYKPIFRITDDGETPYMFGTIPYTSYDSIKLFAQTNRLGAAYVLDDKKKADAFQQSTNPTICNVYSATDKKAPWNDIDNNGNGNVATPILKLAAGNQDPSYITSAQIRYQGRACYEAYAAFIGDYTFAAPLYMTVEKNGKILQYTEKEMQYTLTIPERFRQAGRSFRLLAIGSGTVNIYDDLDTANETITFATSNPTTAYALVYK